MAGGLAFGDALAVLGMLFMGTIKTLLNKLMYGIKAKGIDGSTHSFEKPFFMCLNMFVGMSGCLLPAMFRTITSCCRKPTANLAPEAEEPLLAEAEGEEGAADVAANGKIKVSGMKGLFVVAAPAFLDAVASALSNIGLLFITVSVYQMLRGAVILWNALFGVLFLGKLLNKFHYIGLSLAVIGIVVVGTANLLIERDNDAGKHDDPNRDAVNATWVTAGMAMVVVSQFVQAAGMTMEEFVLREYDLSFSQLVGYEGGCGVILVLFMVLPICYFLPGRDVGGRFENQLDTFYMIGHSQLIIGLLAVDLVAINLFNVAGMRITSTLGALFRSVLEAVRTLNVWLLDLALFYYFSPELGESWSPRWSWLQAIGFAVLVSSALVYGKGNAHAGALAALAAAEGEADEEAEGGEAQQSPAPAQQAPAPVTPASASTPRAQVNGRSPAVNSPAHPTAASFVAAAHSGGRHFVGSPMTASRYLTE